MLLQNFHSSGVECLTADVVSVLPFLVFIARLEISA